ncbi:hypothetical protein EVAR_55771_1 [Eumeta japonica]|uniref:Uncharacterized protein n=1 Tax=Eumeta variegata TaxID=151549 RepID=A0A4C1YKN9_EUMVA|nr:hypothetical protein EVAR_55771_1 [Eumeta japonica]
MATVKQTSNSGVYAQNDIANLVVCPSAINEKHSRNVMRGGGLKKTATTQCFRILHSNQKEPSSIPIAEELIKLLYLSQTNPLAPFPGERVKLSHRRRRPLAARRAAPGKHGELEHQDKYS